ncbi:MAG: apolipoprotein N-acyltransferase [Acidobacteria bacterium]|nr:apolipoprotein N-acyltransferase [Acidobacteriota bacterium]
MLLALAKKILPSWKNALLSLLAAGMLILAFPDFDWWWMAWIALVPLMCAVEREGSVGRSFLLGWLFGTVFFFGTCWWLTYAPIHYASIPWPVAYLLILVACIGAGVFPGIFAAILSHLLKRFGSWAFLAAPFVWVFTEFLRYWLTGNNWNAVGYSQAFNGRSLEPAAYGGVLLCSFLVILPAAFVLPSVLSWNHLRSNRAFSDAFGALVSKGFRHARWPETTADGWPKYFLILASVFAVALGYALYLVGDRGKAPKTSGTAATIIAIQPNVPMSGLNYDKWQQLRQRQFDVAEAELRKLTDNRLPTTVILPESPMNFMYNDDREFQEYVRNFTTRNNVSLLFNSAEPDPTNGKYFNSAVMIGADGKMAAQYDKIYLLPFGEAVPVPFESVMPAFVGNFSYGREYDLLPFGDAAGGIMICFESHFGQLGREYVSRGADVLIEMTNDGYLGPTPVLRQHLANAVFRAVETKRPVLRVTNVGITAYINERGEVLDPAPVYQEDTRVWTISKSDGSQTFYVRYGDWFAWLCSIVTLLCIVASFRRRMSEPPAVAGG